MREETVLSCVQPSGELHLGNYFGAIENWVTLQSSYRCIYGIVDLHAMTMPYKPAILRRNTTDMVLDLLACGIDLNRSVLFIQSLVPEHTELNWILNCVCSYGDLTRQTQFKDKSRQLEDSLSDRFISAGLFTYPVLQAADILIYRADHVPVGKDQEQHLELSRTIAYRFNSAFGEFFTPPKVKFTETPKIRSLVDPEKKMSKSLGSKHYVGLFEDPASVRAKVKIAETDSGDLPEGMELSPGVDGLLEILRACGRAPEADELRSQYQRGGPRRYSELKDLVIEAVVGLTEPFRQRRAELKSREAQVLQEVHASSQKARAVAQETVRAVRDLVGLPNRADA